MSQSSNEVNPSSILETVGSFFSAKGLIIATAGVIGYFLGWRFLYAYYGDFGLDSIFFSFSPPDVISSGWRIYVIIAVLAVGAAALLETIRSVIKHLLDKQQIRQAIYLFFVFFIFGAILVSLVIYCFIFIYASHISLNFYVLAFAGLACLWVAFGAGEKLHEMKQKENNLWYQKAFRFLFPNPILWLTTISIGCVITLAFFSSWFGLTYSKRDQSEASRLQIAKICVDRQLSIPDGQSVNQDEWCYSNLRFLYEADNTYFVFRTSEVSFDATTLYAIPQDSVVEFWLQPWHVTVTSQK
jgi:hypothetical protein